MDFNDLMKLVEENLSYRNDSTDKAALSNLKKALKLKPDDIEIKHQINLLDRIVNYKNYTYPINDKKTEKFVKFFVECCNEKGFERLYDIISEDFVCISRYFGRTKQGFIDSIYLERKSMMGLWTTPNLYETKEREIPCVNLNNFGILFFNIDSDKIIRAFEYKIGEQIDKTRLKKMGCENNQDFDF
jgi:hypothetical protein